MSHRVLFVDDEPMLLNVMERHYGHVYDVHLASSGQEAIEVMSSEEPFDVVVTDMQMPGMTGLQFVEQATEFSPSTRYILLSGNLEVVKSVKGKDAERLTAVLQKPTPRHALAATIQAACAAAPASCAE